MSCFSAEHERGTRGTPTFGAPQPRRSAFCPSGVSVRNTLSFHRFLLPPISLIVLISVWTCPTFTVAKLTLTPRENNFQNVNVWCPGSFGSQFQ